MSKELPYLGPWSLLPTAPGTCPECAVKHEPKQPHNAESLHYQYYFYGQHGRWPTWDDALAHCSEQVKAWWKPRLEMAIKEREAKRKENSPASPDR